MHTRNRTTFALSAAAIAALVLCGGASAAAEKTFSGYSGGGDCFVEYLGSGDSKGNSGTFNAGSYPNIITGYTKSGNAEGNTSAIHGATFRQGFAGLTESGTASGNTLEMDSGSGSMTVAGYATTGSATGNTIRFSGGSVGTDVIGGWGTGLVEGNRAELTGTAHAQKYAYGGYAAADSSGKSGDAKNNSILITDSAVVGMENGDIFHQCAYGGESTKGNATGNSAVMTGGTVYGYLMGGASYGKGAEASGNTTRFEGGRVTFDVTAGYGDGGASVGNTTTMTGGTVEIDVTAAVSNYSVSNNTLIFTGGEAKRQAVAGNSLVHSPGLVTATGNVLRMSGTAKAPTAAAALVTGRTESNTTYISGDASVTKWAYGADSIEDEAVGNSIFITGGTIGQGAIGGYGKLDATGNHLEVTEGATTGNTVAAGLSKAGAATGNTALITGGTIGKDAIGAQGATEAKGNTLTITGGSIVGSANGGYGRQDGAAASGNTLEITGGTVEGFAAGGRSYGSSDGNRTTVSGTAKVSGTAYGGLTVKPQSDPSKAGSASGNTFTVTDGASVGNGTEGAWGGYSVGGPADGNTAEVTGSSVSGRLGGGFGTSSATSNTVTASSATVTGAIEGGYSSGKSDQNTVTVSGSSVDGAVNGGFSNSSDGTSEATGNTVSVTGSTVTGDIAAGTGAAKAAGGTVTLAGSTVGGSVWGGHATGSSGSSDASGNTLTITGSTVSGDVFGGETLSPEGKATGNAITLSASPVVGGTIWGGKTGAMTDAGSIKARANASGNSLTVVGNNATAGNIAGFDRNRFVMPAGTRSGDTMLHLTAAEDTFITGTSVSAEAPGDLTLSVGDKVYLIRKDSGEMDSTGFNGSTSGVSIAKGISAKLSGVMRQDDNDLVLEVTDERLNPGTKVFAESRIAMAGLVNIATDLFVDETFHQIDRDSRKDGGLVPFATVRGSNMRYSTGSHVDLDGFEMNVGAGVNEPNRWGKATAGAFFEYGYGHYKTVAEGVRAKGDSHYEGVGLFAREDFEKGAYLEATFRGGQVKGDFNSHVLGTHFDSKSRYFAGHLGAGFIFRFSDVSKLDTYAKYLWSRIAKDEVRLSTGDPWTLPSVKSDRARIGFRFDRTLNEKPRCRVPVRVLGRGPRGL